jgi:hypothetical protein
LRKPAGPACTQPGCFKLEDREHEATSGSIYKHCTCCFISTVHAASRHEHRTCYKPLYDALAERVEGSGLHTSSHKPQTSSHKPQATSHKPQATNLKPQAYPLEMWWATVAAALTILPWIAMQVSVLWHHPLNTTACQWLPHHDVMATPQHVSGCPTMMSWQHHSMSVIAPP